MTNRINNIVLVHGAFADGSGWRPVWERLTAKGYNVTAVQKKTIKDRVQLKCFRKGKVPVPHLKKMYGRSLMVEVLQDTVRETSNQALADRKLRPAMQPSVTLPEDQAEITRIMLSNLPEPEPIPTD